MDPLIKIPTPKILFTVWIEANVHSPTKNTLNLLLFYVPIYPSLNVTFIEIILVYMVKSTKTTKRNNSCYISGLVFFWTLVRDIPVMTEPLFTGGTMWLETWSYVGLIKYWDTSDCLFVLVVESPLQVNTQSYFDPPKPRHSPVISDNCKFFQPQSPDSIIETIPDFHTLLQLNELNFLMKHWTEN